MIKACLLLIVGMVLLIKGADFFVDGASKIAKALKIPTLIIGLTLVSLGTSLPELSVSLQAAFAGSSDLSLGNVVGSNLFNTFLILGVAALFVPLAFDDAMRKYDVPIMLGIYVVLFLFGFVITPYKLNVVESLVLVVGLVSYIIHLIHRTKNSEEANKVDNEENEKITKKDIIKSAIFVVVGVTAIILGGNFVVNNAVFIAGKLGMSEALIGLTIVAVGTSLPELVTSVVASIKKENDIALGNVIGSNIFNVLFIIGLSSTIKPLNISHAMGFGINKALFDLIILIVSGILVLLIAKLSKNMKRWQGVIFFLLYVGYLLFIIFRDMA